MKVKSLFFVALIALFGAGVAYAGYAKSMKCQAKAAPGQPACGYEATVSFGGGMFSDQITGYCRQCSKFVYLHWTRENLPDQIKAQPNFKIVPRPKPLGEVWDSKTGQVTIIHACPSCKGPFTEIKKDKDIKHCPECNKSGFAVDASKPEIAID